MLRKSTCLIKKIPTICIANLAEKTLKKLLQTGEVNTKIFCTSTPLFKNSSNSLLFTYYLLLYYLHTYY